MDDIRAIHYLWLSLYLSMSLLTFAVIVESYYGKYYLIENFSTFIAIYEQAYFNRIEVLFALKYQHVTIEILIAAEI